MNAPSEPLRKNTEDEKPHDASPHQRLRERLFNVGANAMQDYELLELLLFAAPLSRHRDVKPLAKQLMAEEMHQHGMIDHTPVYPREVVWRALEVGAGALVLVHNHPSGGAQPSRRAIADACRPLDLALHDHIIIGRGEPASSKAMGLL